MDRETLRELYALRDAGNIDKAIAEALGLSEREVYQAIVDRNRTIFEPQSLEAVAACANTKWR